MSAYVDDVMFVEKRESVVEAKICIDKSAGFQLGTLKRRIDAVGPVKLGRGAKHGGLSHPRMGREEVVIGMSRRGG